MAHYAVIEPETSTVVRVFVGRDENDLPEGVTDWELYYAPEGYVVKRTSYNTFGGVHSQGGTPFRGNYAGIGFKYDEENDVFVAPQPYPSWTLSASYLWEAPVALPDDADTVSYEWNEETVNWVVAAQE